MTNWMWPDTAFSLTPDSIQGWFSSLHAWGKSKCTEGKSCVLCNNWTLRWFLLFNERRFNLQDRKKLFTHKLSIPSQNIYQVRDLGILSYDLYCETCDKGILSVQCWSTTKFFDGFPNCALEHVLLPQSSFIWTGLSDSFFAKVLILFNYPKPWSQGWTLKNLTPKYVYWSDKAWR